MAASEETFILKVFTPLGLEIESKVTSVSLPGSDGEVGVLTRHARYTGIVGIGIIEFIGPDGEKNRAMVSGGFVSFSNDVLTILADSVETRESASSKDYAKDRATLTATVQTGSGYTAEWQLAAERLSCIEAIDRLLS